MHATVIAGRFVMMAGSRFFTSCRDMMMLVQGGGRGRCLRFFGQTA